LDVFGELWLDRLSLCAVRPVMQAGWAAPRVAGFELDGADRLSSGVGRVKA
jgi:hypothetical protein